MIKTDGNNQPPRPQINFAVNESALYCGALLEVWLLR